MILPTSPEQLAKALLPGLKALTMQAMEQAVFEVAKGHLQEWLRSQFKTGTIQTSVTPEGKLVFLIELDPREAP